MSTPARALPRRLAVSGAAGVGARLRFTRLREGKVGLALVAFVLLTAFIGPLLAPHDPAQVVGQPVQGPGAGHLLGTDGLGRDVLSRLLHGGRSVIGLALLSMVMAYAIGMAAGLSAGYRRGWYDELITRGADILLSFPPLLLMLLLLTGAGSGWLVLVIGVALVHLPGITRLVRAATLETTGRAYVEAAEVNGESTAAILRRELLPAVLPSLIADAGLRYTFCILMVAAVNFLGLGLQPPAADWALMISENRLYITLNPWAIAAPAVLIAALTIGVNLVGDAISRSLGRSNLEAV